MMVSAFMNPDDTPENSKQPEPSLWKTGIFGWYLGRWLLATLATLISKDGLDIGFVDFASRLPPFLLALSLAWY
ncbi:MAG: hypothetical protein COB08_006405 [Rhodobacteraceae bacterium]|nr:hypothetical protein [Paracoccaceae bacterium]